MKVVANIERGLKEFVGWENPIEPGERQSLAFLRRGLKRMILLARPNIALRYQPVLAFLRQTGREGAAILEVGSGSVGITRYLRQPVTGLDVSFSGPKTADMSGISGSATRMPFHDRAFDVVVSLDMIEHLSAVDRRRAVAEMIRVARETVIIGCPCGENAKRWEDRAREACRRKLQETSSGRAETIRRRSGFLYEHLDHGLPTELEVRGNIDGGLADGGRSGSVEVEANESAVVWYMLALGMMRLTIWWWIGSTVMGMVLMPIMKRVRWGGTYRRVFFISIGDWQDHAGSDGSAS